MDWTLFFNRYPASPLPFVEQLPHGLPLFIAVGHKLESLTFIGPEAGKFLQGQVTCDIHEVTQDFLRLGAHCNAKGRAQATFLAFANDELSSDSSQHITFLLPEGMAEPTHQQLKKYAAFSKVSLATSTTDSDDSLIATLVGGEQAHGWLTSQGLTLSDTPLHLTRTQHVQITALDASGKLFLLLTDASSLEDLLATAPAGLQVADQNGWWQCLTALSQAHVFPSTQEQFIPQELNYDLIGGISFKKGCYKGQEIVARLHYKGTPKSRVALFALAADKAPAIGCPLIDSDGKRLGDIVQIAENGSGHHLLLAVVKTERDESKGLFAEGAESAPLRAVSLPYAIT